MKQSTTTPTVSFTPCAPLAALGLYLRQIKLLAPIRDGVKIVQKHVVHTPIDKLTDAFITILAGGQGLVRSIRGCAAIRPCRMPLDGIAARTNRPFRRR